MGDPEQRRLARFSTQDECLKAQWKKLDEEFEQQTHVHQTLTSDYQKKQLAFEMSLPEIDSTVSVYCAPSLRYSLWPYYTPTYADAADDLRRLGERTLALRAKEMLSKGTNVSRNGARDNCVR